MFTLMDYYRTDHLIQGKPSCPTRASPEKGLLPEQGYRDWGHGPKLAAPGVKQVGWHEPSLGQQLSLQSTAIGEQLRNVLHMKMQSKHLLCEDWCSYEQVIDNI